MQKTMQTSASILFAIIILWITIPLDAIGKEDVQYIAIHFGNPEYAKVVDPEDYPGFSFYTVDDEVYEYIEKPRMVGNPKYLQGYYGKLPETMGFNANRAKDKKGLTTGGTIMVVDKASTIYYQLPIKNLSNSSLASDFSKAVRKVAKGKLAKVLKPKKCKYLKSTPFGVLEPTKGVKLDKKDKGLTGWKLPDYDIEDENGQTVSLLDLVRGKSTVIIFYTMRAVHFKGGDKDGHIFKEWDHDPPGKFISSADIDNKVQEKDSNHLGALVLKTTIAGIVANDTNKDYLAAAELLEFANKTKNYFRR